MNITIKNRRSITKLLAQQDTSNTIMLDLTSKGPTPWVKFSPFYPIGDIPIPFSGSATAASVEGIWQGLKVFETTGIDPTKFDNQKMKGLKRTVRKFGKVLGHQKGLQSSELLPYVQARKQIYAPIYQWVLKHKLQAEIAQIRQLQQQYEQIILLDYETNGDIEDPSRPLSHAFLVKHYIEDNYPI